jgi:hypothetical protein
MNFAPNRVAVYLTSLAGLLAALAPVVADLDLTSTVGIVGGLGGVVLVVRKWLEGWQKHEERAFYGRPAQVGSAGQVSAEEPGDVLPGVPHLGTNDPANVPADQGDAGVIS